MTKQNLNQRAATRGVTLVELLVVISILSVVAAVLIPRLRMINKDRNIREASRMVASAFAKASTRAVNDGISGLVIVPNTNFREGSKGFQVPGVNDAVLYAGTRIYQMRRMPAYIGDDEFAVATAGGGAVIEIPRPFEHNQSSSPPRLVVRRFDQISFNGSAYRYLITNVNLNGAKLELSLDSGSAPPPEMGDGVPFVIHRQPRRLESSRVELPNGYMIDLRYSGPTLNSGTEETFGTRFNQNPPNGGTGEITLYFDANGGVDRMFYYDSIATNPGQVVTRRPISSLYWFVSYFDPDPNAIDPIASPSNKWVTVDHLTGSVNVASSAIPLGTDFNGSGTVTLADAIGEAREIADERRSAGQ